MNRQQRRKQKLKDIKAENRIKKKIDAETFEKYFSERNKQLIEEESKRAFNETYTKYWVTLQENLKKSMKNNRISEERIEKIFKELSEL